MLRLKEIDRGSAVLFAAALGLNIMQWVVVAVWPKTDVAPLHYTIYFGIDLTGAGWQLYGLPFFGSVVLVLHVLVSRLQTMPGWTRLWAVVALGNLVLTSATLATLRVISLR